MSYSADTFVADEQPTTAKWNKLWSNDASFNDGTGIGAGAIGTTQLAASSVTAAKRTGGFFVGNFSVTATGNKAITGVGFQPSAVMFVSTLGTTVASGANAGLGVGFMDSAGNQAVTAATTRNANGGAVDTVTDHCIWVDTISAGGGSRSVNISGKYVSMDSDGFTVNIDVYATTQSVYYLAMR